MRTNIRCYKILWLSLIIKQNQSKFSDFCHTYIYITILNPIKTFGSPCTFNLDLFKSVWFLSLSVGLYKEQSLYIEDLKDLWTKIDGKFAHSHSDFLSLPSKYCTDLQIVNKNSFENKLFWLLFEVVAVLICWAADRPIPTVRELGTFAYAAVKF